MNTRQCQQWKNKQNNIGTNRLVHFTQGALNKTDELNRSK